MRSSKVLAPIVAGSIASLKVAVTAAVVATPVAPSAGVVAVTVGGVVSVETVVKLHTLGAASALPARSLTPTVTVAV